MRTVAAHLDAFFRDDDFFFLGAPDLRFELDARRSAWLMMTSVIFAIMIGTAISMIVLARLLTDVGTLRFICGYFERLRSVDIFASRRTVRPVGDFSAFFETPAFFK